MWLSQSKLAVNFAGYLRAELGLGEAARGYVRALHAQGIQVHLVDASDLCETRLQDDSLALAPQSPVISVPHPINIIHINPDRMLLFLEKVGASFFEERYNIGIWAWEAPDFPTFWYDRFDLLDEIWVGSSYMANIIGRVSPVPVICFPHVVSPPAISADRTRFGLAAEEFIFLFTFDFNSTFIRKNPQATLAAFQRAFHDTEPVRLVLKSVNGQRRRDQLLALKQQAKGSRVTVIDQTLSSDDRYQLLACCDSFVSLHRAEGFGLAIAEAMALGKPVIATGWSGNMDFMTSFNSLPVSYQLRTITQDDPPYAAGVTWAEVDVENAAQLMRQVWQEKALAERLGRRARQDLRQLHSPETVGVMLQTRLRLIGQRSHVHKKAELRAGRLRRIWLQHFMFNSLHTVWLMLLQCLPLRYHERARQLTAKLRQRLLLLR